MANLTERGRMVLGKLLAAEKAGPLPDVDKEILADLKQAAGILSDDGPTAGDYGKAALETAGEAITLPGRVARGLAISVLEGGGERDKTMEAIVRGSMPDYKPTSLKEGVVGTVGQIVGDASTLGVGGVLAKAPKVASKAYNLGRGMIEGAALSGATAAAKGGDIEDVGVGAGVGAAAQIVPTAAGSALKKGYKLAIAGLKGVPTRIIDIAFDAAQAGSPTVQGAAQDFFDAVANQQGAANQALNKAGQFAKKTLESASSPARTAPVAADVAEQAAAFSEALGAEASRISKDAASLLRKDVRFPQAKLLAKVAAGRAQITKRSLGLGQEGFAAKEALDHWKSSLKKLYTKKGYSEYDLKRVIRAIDDDTNWEGIAGTQTAKTLRGLRHSFDELLKESNDAYAEAIEPASKILKKKEAFDYALGLDAGTRRGKTLPTDTATSKIGSMLTGKKDFAASAAKKAGFQEIEKGQRAYQAFTTQQDAIKAAKDVGERALTQAESGLVTAPALSKVQSAAEAAARTGRLDSPQGQALIELLSPVLGEEAPTEAWKLVLAASKEGLERSRASSSMQGAVRRFGGEAFGDALFALGKKFQQVAPTAGAVVPREARVAATQNAGPESLADVLKRRRSE